MPHLLPHRLQRLAVLFLEELRARRRSRAGGSAGHGRLAAFTAPFAFGELLVRTVRAFAADDGALTPATVAAAAVPAFAALCGRRALWPVVFRGRREALGQRQ